MSDNISADSTEDPWCDSTKPKVISYSEIQHAQKLISTPDGIPVTPCIRAHLSDLMGTEIYLKLENYNLTGCFKERGARCCMMQLPDDMKKRGVVTASMGNHSQGVSYHGMKLGIPATVVMPVVAPRMKVNRCRRYGATIILHGNNMSEAKKRAREIAKEQGLAFINGYDHPHVIAGQGVVGLEILDQIGPPDAVICPCGGGGLIAGVLVTMKEKSPKTEIIGVESVKCPAFSNAMQLGRPKRTVCSSSIADGLGVPKVGYNSVATCLGRLDHMLVVSESLINVCVLNMIEHEKMIVEGSGATPLAALLSGKLSHLKGKKVVLVLSGGNIDATMLGRVLERALVSLGRYTKVAVYITDRPNAQAELFEGITKIGVNIKHIHCERAWIPEDDFLVKVNLLCETMDIDNALELRKYLIDKYGRAEFPDFPNVCKAKALTGLEMGH